MILLYIDYKKLYISNAKAVNIEFFGHYISDKHHGKY